MKSKFECGGLCPLWVVFWRYCCSTSDWVGRHLHLMPYDMSSSMSGGYISQKVSCVFSPAPSLTWTHSIYLFEFNYTPQDPWDERYIYLHECLIFVGKSVGKYTVRPMDPSWHTNCNVGTWIRFKVHSATPEVCQESLGRACTFFWGGNATR